MQRAATVWEEGRLALLDAKATPQVVDAIRSSDRDRGIKLRVSQKMQGEEMETTCVEEV